MNLVWNEWRRIKMGGIIKCEKLAEQGYKNMSELLQIKQGEIE